MLYVSSVAPHQVTRYGTGTGSTKAELVGAKLDITTGRVTWFEDRIIPITDREEQLFSREYSRAIKLGQLKPRTHEEYEAWYKKSGEEAARAKAEKLAETKPAAEEAKPSRAAKAGPGEGPRALASERSVVG